MSDARAVALARSQLGLISRSQANAVGVSDTMLHDRVRSGRWRSIRRGVFVIGAAPSSWEQQTLATCLAGGPDVVASHRTALRLWGLVNAAGRPELLVQGRRRVRVDGVTVHQSLLLPDLDRTRRHEVPVTSLSRTIIDGSHRQDPRTVGGWIDEGIRHLDLDLRELRSCLARLQGPGRRDTRSVREALALRVPGYDPGGSKLEADVLRALVDEGLPLPIQQLRVVRPNGQVAFIDLAYPDAMIAIEADGWMFHSQRGPFDDDRLRRNDATLLGWMVFHYTSSMDLRAFARMIALAHRQATDGLA